MKLKKLGLIGMLSIAMAFFAIPAFADNFDIVDDYVVYESCPEFIQKLASITEMDIVIIATSSGEMVDAWLHEQIMTKIADGDFFAATDLMDDEGLSITVMTPLSENRAQGFGLFPDEYFNVSTSFLHVHEATNTIWVEYGITLSGMIRMHSNGSLTPSLSPRFSWQVTRRSTAVSFGNTAIVSNFASWQSVANGFGVNAIGQFTSELSWSTFGGIMTPGHKASFNFTQRMF